MRQLPRNADLKVNLALSALFTIIFGVVYLGADLLSATVYERSELALAFEADIPFVPQMAIVYLSIIPLLLLAPLLLDTPRKLFPLFAVLSLEVLVAGVAYILFPMRETFPPHHTEGVAGFFFRVADTLNLNHNDLPSLHVALALTAAAVYAKFCTLAGKAVFYCWAALIAVSSLLMHQHHIADIAAGALLAAAGLRLAYPVFAQSALFDALRAECICASEFARFTRRHPRYLLIAFFLYANAPFHWRKTRTMRVGFCLLQALDDLLDGDRHSDAEPACVAAALIGQLESGQFGDDRYCILAKTLADDLARLPEAGADALNEVIALMRHMTVDRERVLRRSIYDADRLRRHHRQTFTHSLDLLLIVAEARARAGDVPELIEAFGWCSTMRDLREDLRHGLVNIPADVVRAATGEGVTLSDFAALIETHAIRNWFATELERARRLLEAFERRVPDRTDRRGERILSLFHRSICRYARRFERQYRLTPQPRPVASET